MQWAFWFHVDRNERYEKSGRVDLSIWNSSWLLSIFYRVMQSRQDGGIQSSLLWEYQLLEMWAMWKHFEIQKLSRNIILKCRRCVNILRYKWYPGISKEYHLEMCAMCKYFEMVGRNRMLGAHWPGSLQGLGMWCGEEADPQNCIFIFKSVDEQVKYSRPFTQVWILTVSKGLDKMFNLVLEYFKQQFLVGFVENWRLKLWTKV